MRRSVWILLGGTPLWLAGSAFAQATPEGAAALRDGLNQAWAPLLTAKIQDKPLFAGPVTVEAAGADYTVVIPAATLSMTVQGKGGPESLASHCDSQTYHGTETGTGIYRLETDSPFSCVVQVGTEPAITVAGGSRTRFGFDLAQKLVTDVDMTVADLKVSQEGKPPVVEVDKVTLTGAITPAADPAHQNLTFHYAFDGVSGGDPAGKVRFTLASAVYDGRMDGADMHALMAAYGKMMGVYSDLLQVITAAGRQPNDPLPPAFTSGMLDFYREAFSSFGGAGNGTVVMTGLRVAAPPMTVTLDKLSEAVTVDGLAGESGNGRFDLELAGLGIDPPLPFAQWIPSDAQIKLAGSRLPYQTLGKAYLSFIETALGSAGQAGKPPSAEQQQKMQQMMMQSYAQMGAALQQAGTRLDVEAFHFAAPEAAIDLAGSVLGDAAAAHGVTADLKLRFTNLDGLIKFVQSMPDGAQAASGLTMAQVLGRQATTGDGKPARDYDLVVDAAGKILVNGTDLGALAGKKR